MREAGIAIRLFDLMDEKVFNIEWTLTISLYVQVKCPAVISFVLQRFKSLQVAEFVSYLIKPYDADPALENWLNFQQYCDAVEGYVDAEQQVWDPLQKKSKKIITTSQLKVVLKRGNRDPNCLEEMTTTNILVICSVVFLILLFLAQFF